MKIRNVHCWVENLTWPDIEKRIRDRAIGILPIGAASKEHGRHLPLNTDFLQAQWLADEIGAQENVLIWPVLGYGYYPAFVDYPGSISIDASVFASVVCEILNGMFFSGLQKIIILNTGISTIPPLEAVITQHPNGNNIRLHNIYSGRSFLETAQAIEAQSFGGHADELETSIMLALDESLVKMEFARSPIESKLKPISKGLFNRTNPEEAGYSPDGVNGDPSLGTKEKGVRLLKALKADCLSIFSD